MLLLTGKWVMLIHTELPRE